MYHLFLNYVNHSLQQPSQIMKGTLIKPLRGGAKRSWLLDEEQYLYRRDGDYKKGNFKYNYASLVFEKS